MPVVHLFNLGQSFSTLTLAQTAEVSRSIGIGTVMYDLRLPHIQVQQQLDCVVEHWLQYRRALCTPGAAPT